MMEFLANCQKIAHKYFGIQKLRSSQEKVFHLITKNKFVLATLPTGSGKTLLYAVPSLIFTEGPVLVISPLISLMRDQMRRMKNANVASVLFTSDQTEDERLTALNNLWSAETKLVFISPERFVMPSFFQKIERLKPSMVVIDEAHCVVSWGHQFRPEYSEISKYLSQIQPPRILALTATASADTRQEMIRKIFPKTFEVSQFISKPIGSHIYVKSVRAFSFDEQKQQLIDILQFTKSKKSIVYFSTRKQCEEFAVYLKHKQLNTVAYHAGLSKDMRKKMEEYILHTDRKTVICATTAFGLGVDISDVTLVVVYGFPSNIEEFLQMIGRAGRNGQASEGILIWTGSDPVKRNLQFQNIFPTKTEFKSKCQKIAKILPKQEGESCFVLLETFQKNLFFNEKSYQVTSKTEGFLGALRVCQMMEDILMNEDYYEIRFKNSISHLINLLPNSPTKRFMILKALKDLINPNLHDKSEINVILPVKKIFLATSLSPSSCEEVLIYYADQGLISFKKLDSNQLKLGVILKNGIQMIKSNLDRYLCIRQYFYSSLKELTKFAEAPRCRLESSYRYFQVPNINHPNFLCFQCDLCKSYEGMSCKKS